MAYVKENKRQMRAKLQALYRPYPVAMNDKGDPSFAELTSRLHQSCLANKPLDEHSQRYKDHLLRMAPVASLDFKDTEDGVETTGFATHTQVMYRLRRYGYTVNAAGKWVKSCK